MSRYTLSTGWGLVRLPHARRLESEIDKALQEVRDAATDSSHGTSYAQPSSASASPADEGTGSQSSSLSGQQPMRDFERKALHDYVLANLRTSIRSGHYRPGDHLGEVVLAKELGVSRGTIRGVLRQLQQEGLLATGARGMLRVQTGSGPAISDAGRVVSDTEPESVKRAEDVPDPRNHDIG